ncbi:MAG: NAD(P)-dependent oxidoreductase [Burkholderiales bacterium]
MNRPPPAPRGNGVGVIGAGAMGMGVVRSLLRGGFATRVRDTRPEAEREAATLGAAIDATPAELAAACAVTIVLVVDARQVDDVLFGPGGAAAALPPAGIVVVSSTIDPDDVAALAARVAATGGTFVDAPVSGGPARAADGSMTIMAAGDDTALERCDAVFRTIAGRVFRVGTRAGDAAKFKIVNNLLAAVNLAAGAEALALAAKAGLDPRQVVDVVNASSGGSWIFADRMPRALDGDYAPRAAARVLTKDVGIAVDFARRLGVDAAFARAASDAFRATVAAGLGEEDDAAIYKWNRARAGMSNGEL